MPMHMGDAFSRQEPNPVRAAYRNSECPDCGEPLPENVQEGDECGNCGHVYFNERRMD